MTSSKFLLITALFTCMPRLYAGEAVQQLLNNYSQIETVSCQMRRTVDGAGGKIKFISRIYYTNKDQLHVDNLSPLKRRTLADGTRLFQYVEGSPKGFSRPIDALSEPMKISLRKIPGTAMDHLLRLSELPETPLPAENGAPRIGIASEKNYAVLEFDSPDRLARLTFYKTEQMRTQIADYTYSDFHEVLPNLFIPFSHHALFPQGPDTYTETIRLDQFTANQPIAASLFIASNFFNKNIDFVADFAKISPAEND